MNRAVMQLPPPFGSSSLKGLLAAEVWRMLELLMQVRSVQKFREAPAGVWGLLTQVRSLVSDETSGAYRSCSCR